MNAGAYGGEMKQVIQEAAVFFPQEGVQMCIRDSWRIALVVWGGFLILTILTRYVSLGSCWAGASFPFATWFVYQDLVITLLSIVIGGLILWKHRTNIQRLLNGSESKFSFHRKKEGQS